MWTYLIAQQYFLQLIIPTARDRAYLPSRITPPLCLATVILLQTPLLFFIFSAFTFVVPRVQLLGLFSLPRPLSCSVFYPSALFF